MTLQLRWADWARDWAVEEVYGIWADVLNDDRLGRALDAVAPRVDHLVGSIGARPSRCSASVTRLHWDTTLISLYGANDQVDADQPAPVYGYPKGPAHRSQTDPGRHRCSP